MRICFIGGTRYHQPLDDTTRKKFCALSELGQIFVVGFSTTLFPRVFREYAIFYQLPLLPWSWLRYAELVFVATFVVLYCIFRHDVQILVAQSPYEGVVGGVTKLLSKLFRKQVVCIVESHGDFEESLFVQKSLSFPGIYRAVMRRAARFSIKHADAVRAVSNFTRSQLGKWAPRKPVVQFPAWTDIDVFFEAFQKEPSKNSNMVVLFVGALTPVKGVHLLLEAFSAVLEAEPNVKLWVIGKSTDQNYTQNLKGQAKKLKIDGRTTFLDDMSQVELAQYMAQANVLVLPSLSEGLGRVVLEGMACGIPVIGSAIGGIPDLVEDGVTGFLVNPGDIASLSNKILWILTHADLSHQMGQRGRTFAKEYFSLSKYVQGYSQLFREAQRATISTTE